MSGDAPTAGDEIATGGDATGTGDARPPGDDMAPGDVTAVGDVATGGESAPLGHEALPAAGDMLGGALGLLAPVGTMPTTVNALASSAAAMLAPAVSRVMEWVEDEDASVGLKDVSPPDRRGVSHARNAPEGVMKFCGDRAAGPGRPGRGVPRRIR